MPFCAFHKYSLQCERSACHYWRALHRFRLVWQHSPSCSLFYVFLDSNLILCCFYSRGETLEISDFVIWCSNIIFLLLVTGFARKFWMVILASNYFIFQWFVFYSSILVRKKHVNFWLAVCGIFFRCQVETLIFG